MEQVIETCDVTWEALAEYAEGRGNGADQTRLAAHLAQGCGECRERLDWLARAAPALAAPPLPPAPAAVQRRARALFRERLRRPAARPWPLIARLLGVGRAGPVFARGDGGPGDAAHRVYAVEGREIDVWEEPEPGGVSYLIGQVAAAGQTVPPLTAVSLRAGDDPPQAAALEEEEFHLRGVRPGTYSLTLTLGDETILIPGLIIPAPLSAPSVGVPP